MLCSVVLVANAVMTTAVDIFSFGICALEVLYFETILMLMKLFHAFLRVSKKVMYLYRDLYWMVT